MLKKFFRKMPLVLAVCGLAIVLTGCGGTNNPTDTGPAWLSSAGLWREDTGQRVTAVAANDVGAAVEFVRENPGTFTLAIGEDVPFAGTRADIWRNVGNVDLTIVGLGGQRKIIFTDPDALTTRLFEVGPDSSGDADIRIRLTLGNNITLVGRTYGEHEQTNHSTDLIRVRHGGHLIMKAGSRITAHTSTAATNDANGAGAAVHISTNGTFTMYGGEIIGNRANNAAADIAGGVFVRTNTSALYLKGEEASITGNFRGTDDTSADVVIHTAVPAELGNSLEADGRIGAVVRR